MAGRTGTTKKSVSVLKAEGTSHKTKKELEEIEKSETAMLTGITLKEEKEVKENPEAHKEFLRVKKVLKNANKDDALFQTVINRYCLILAEIKELAIMIEDIKKDVQRLQDEIDNGGDFEKLTRLKNSTIKIQLDLDKQMMTKRNAAFSIEKENCFTVQSASKTISTKTDDGEEINPLLKALRD